MTKLRVDRDWNDSPPFCLHSPISVLKAASFIEQVDTLRGRRQCVLVETPQWPSSSSQQPA
jgi:hypothetical protein